MGGMRQLRCLLEAIRPPQIVWQIYRSGIVRQCRQIRLLDVGLNAYEKED
jgi:hypothetical protein